MKTYSPKPEHIERRWYVVDASDQVLGRLASEVAAIIRGKHKPIFAPHMDTGDHVIVINADKVVLTGGKETKKIAYRHSGYPGGINAIRYDELLATRPVFAVEKAVRGMLPKNRLGRTMIGKLHVVAGSKHPHAAQKPVPYTLGHPPAWEGLPVAVPAELKTRHRSGAQEESSEKATSAPTPSKPKASTTKPSTKKSTSTAPSTTAKKATAKKTTAKKPAAKKTTAKKATTAKKTTAKKTTAKKPAATKAAPTPDADSTEE
jgi:large subunit ribosomal protein L13